jgi:hypothetical protein
MGHNHNVQLLSVRVTPDDDPNGFGILVDGSMSLPFTLERAYAGVQGYYFEQYLIVSGDQTVFASQPQQIFIRGLQSSTVHTSHVDDRIPLSAGTCDLVFVVDDIRSEPIELTVNAVASV